MKVYVVGIRDGTDQDLGRLVFAQLISFVTDFDKFSVS